MISPTAEYALRAVVAIAQAGGDAIVTPTIVEMTKVPAGYLPKVLQTLRKGRIVDSKRGLGGGFTLARPAEQISVLDVVNAVDPIHRIETCPLRLEAHGQNLCPLHQRLDDALSHMEASFAATSIAELLITPTDSPPLCPPSKPLRVTLPAAVNEKTPQSA